MATKNPQPPTPEQVDAPLTNIPKRRITDQLPALLDTDLIKKFFAGSGDHLYQPEVSERLVGFIGEIPSYVDFSTDFYINEPSKTRRDHQLETTAISSDPNTNETTNIMFYDDMVNLLRFQGGLVNNEDRLFETEYYCWCPCIDLDKIMNFTNYFWFPGGPDVIRFTTLTDIGSYIGSSSTVIIQGIELQDGDRVVFTNDVDFSFNNRVFIVQGVGVSFNLMLELDLYQYLWDDPLVAWDEGPWDGPDPQLAVDFNSPDYVVMGRGAADGNPWSDGNFWYHRDELSDTQLDIALSSQAERPIIEFCKNMELFNYGTFGRAPVTVRDDNTTDPDVEIVGQSSLTIDGVILGNGDTILFTQAPTLEGTWGVPPWDLEDAPDGEWDPFFNVFYSAPASDITLISSSSILTTAGDFTALGFTAGMKIQLNGTSVPYQDGTYTISSITTTINPNDTINIVETFPSIVSGLPETNQVTISEIRIEYQNRIFRIDGLGTVGGATLTLVADGQNPDGSPTDGDKIHILLGIEYANRDFFFDADLNEWVESQTKQTINQEPLFQLYDTQGIQLNDPGTYPNSNFTGSRVFGFQINDDPRQPLDSVLGVPLVFDEFGEIEYENYLVTERYQFNLPQEEIIGYYFYRIISENEDEFFNDWFLAPNRTRQFLVNRYTADTETRDFTLDVAPDTDTLNEVEVHVNGLETDNPWTIAGNIISFANFFQEDDLIQVRYFSSEIPPNDGDATYEIPDNLEANPDDQEIDVISRTDFFDHFSTIIENQIGFEGIAASVNNWRDTPKDRSLGTEILQHRAPMLKIMGTGSNRNTDIIRAARFAEREFTRFRNKFLRKVNEYFNDGIHSDTQPPSEWVEDALTSINLGKTTDFPFAYSGMGIRENGDPTFIPPSPSRLGVYPVYAPEKYTDLTLRKPKDVLQFHDGSIIIAFDDFRDDVILELEQNIYDSIPDEFKTEERPDFDWTDFVEAQFRDGDYSEEEFNTLMTPIIQRWAITNNLDLTSNEDYSPTDPFTYNYSSLGLPGYWRGIFKEYYDTDRPNTHPWEMFGFSIKPDWWDARYGPRPYKSTNLFLWNDMQVGRIADGPRAGVDPKYARSGAPTPVDVDGNILDPITLGIAIQPGAISAQDDWKIGDDAPVENEFKRSPFYSFAISQVGYLMKPARFMEIGWDPKLGLYRYPDGQNPQWLHTDTEDRKRNSEFTVHGETQDDGTVFTSDGIQQWISDYIASNGQSVTTTFGDLIRTLEPKLGHKMAGYINANTTRVLADNFGLVPAEDVNTNLYRNPSIREEIYSGVIIERVEDGWAVYGYDVLDPFFNIVPGITTSRKIPIDINTLRVLECTRFKDGQVERIPYGTKFKTQQDIYNFLISYGQYLESRGWVFDEYDGEINDTHNWRLAGKQFLFWSLGRWANGSIISLSPLSEKVKFQAEQGIIQSVEQIINGVYSLLDRDGRVIQPEDTFVSRYEDVLTIEPSTDQAIYSVRLFIAELEHVITFNNVTIFNDLIYNPLLKLRQARFKLFTTRAGGWNGRLDAPGFIITDNGLIPNYEKTTNDFRKFFDIENPVERPQIQHTARRVIGFQTRDFMDNLELEPNVQFQFFQGFIRKKGTKLTLDRLLRSDATTSAEELEFYEEWAFRVGEYGAVQDATSIELQLQEEEWRGEPQLIEFVGSKLASSITASATSLMVQDGSTFPDSGVITIDSETLFYQSKSTNMLNGLLRGQKNTVAADHNTGTDVALVDTPFDDALVIAPNDQRWIIKPPLTGIVKFPYRQLSGSTQRSPNAAYLLRIDTPLAGYPLPVEVTYRVDDIDARNDQFNSLKESETDDNLAFGDTIWVDDIGDYYTRNDPDNFFDDDPKSIFNFGFMVYRYTDTELDFSIATQGGVVGISTTLETTTSHYLDNTDYIMIDGSVGSDPELNGSYFVTNITFNFEGDGSTTTFTMPEGVLIDPATGATTVTINDMIETGYEIIGGLETVVTSTVEPEYDVGDVITINSVHIELITPLQPVVPTILGGDPGATTSPGSVISISDGIATATIVTLNGSDVDAAIEDINDAGPPNIIATKTADALILTNGTGGEIVIEDVIGTPVFDLFGISSMSFTTPLPQANVDAAVIDINNAGVPNIVAANSNGLLQITETSGAPIELDEVTPGALSALGLSIGTTESLGNAILFDVAPTSGDDIVVRREKRFDIDFSLSVNGSTSNATIGIYTESRFKGESNPNLGDRNDYIYRDSFTTPQGNAIPWTSGELTYIDEGYTDSNGMKFWVVFEFNGSSWDTAQFDDVNRIQSKRIDTELFKQALVFNNNTNVTDLRLNIWDPAKGLFPGQTVNEIDIRLEFDPATYTNGDSTQYRVDPGASWGDEKVGMRWWDLSAVEYEQYEIGSNRERRNKWGRLAPGKSIAVYEWVRSSVPPTQWAELVNDSAEQPASSFSYKPSGEAYLADEVENPPYSQRTRVDSQTGDEVTDFFFWVLDSETIPDIANKNLSVAQISRQMTNPTTSGLSWYAPISENALIVSGVGNILTEMNTVLQLNFNFTRTDVNLHREWTLSREGDESAVPTDRFWNKMKDSLAGFDVNNNLVPDPNLEEARKYGNFIRPRQTWFIDREEAGRIFLDCANNLLAQDCDVDTRPDLFDNLYNASEPPTLYVSGDHEDCDYNYHVSDNETRDLLTTQAVLDVNSNLVGPMSAGEQVWVDGIPETSGYWKVYAYIGIDGSGNPIFTETCSEAYRVADFWRQIDYVVEGFDQTIPPDIVVDTITERDAIVNPEEGLLVRVNDANSDGSNTYAIFEYDSVSDPLNPWILQVKEDCVVEFIIDNFYDPSIGNIDVRTGLEGRDQALQEVIDALRTDILTDLEQNLLFFKMVRYVHSEQLLVDWVFKTTFIVAVGLNRSANQDPIFKADTTQSLIDFINEAKPYHTKLRDFIINQDFGIDIHEANVTDFDKPVYFDEGLDDYRVLDPDDPDDMAIMDDPDALQNDWFANYEINPDLIRTFNSTLKIDRVSCDVAGGWDPLFGWDYGPNEDWDLSIESVTETASERILKYYQPQPLSAEDVEAGLVDPFKNIQETKDIASMISGCNFKGTIVDGGGMVIDINDYDTFLSAGPFVNAVIGTASATYSNGDDIIINGISVVLSTGTTVDDAVIDINAAAITDIESVNNDGALQISAPLGIIITLAEGAGTALDDLGFTAGTYETPIPGSNPEDIIVDGNLFVQPDFDSNHPEELVLQTTGESINLIVHTLGINGAPQIFSDSFVGSSGPHELSQKPASKEAVFVYVNGVRSSPDEFTLDNNSNVTLIGSLAASIGPNDTITIISFSIGGGEEIIDKVITEGDGITTSFAMNVTPSSGQVFVNVNGVIGIDGVDYNVVGNDIVFNSPPPFVGDEIIITVFASVDFTVVKTNQFDLGISGATFPADNIYSIGQTVAASPTTDIDDVFVSINGIRQRSYDVNNPTRNYDYRLDTVTDEIVFVVKETGSFGATYTNSENIIINAISVPLTTGTTVADAVIDINAAGITDITALEADSALVIINNVGDSIELTEGGGTALADLGLPDTSGTPKETSFTVDSSIIISSLSNEYLTVECQYNGSIVIFGVSHDIVVEDQIEVINVTTATTLTLTNDYTVNTTLNTVDITNGIGSSISLNDELRIKVYYASTEVFQGNSSGFLGQAQYTVIQSITNVSRLFAHLNGVRQEVGVDFEILDEKTIRFFNGHTPTDQVIITILAGRSGSAPPIAFRQFLSNTDANAANIIQPQAKTTIAASVSPSDITIKVTRTSGFPLTGTIVIVDDQGDFLTWEMIRYNNITQVNGIIGATYINSENIIINGTNVVLSSGTTVNDAIVDINNATILHIVASSNGGALTITNTVGGSITLAEGSGTALANLGLIPGVFDNGFANGTITVTQRGFENTTPASHSVGAPVYVLNPSVPEIANWQSFRISDEGTTTLASPLNINDATIELTSVAGLPKQKPANDRMEIPGVIWLKGEVEVNGNNIPYFERIEYYKRTGTTLKFIRRGTGGTSSSIPAVYNAGGELVDDFQTVSNFTWPAGTKIVDGTNKQKIPGGYRWAPAPYGLQFLNSVLSKFLRDKPGSC